jgi:hypothetical protein
LVDGSCGEAKAVRPRTAIHKKAAAMDTVSNKRKLARPYCDTRREIVAKSQPPEVERSLKI